MASTVATALAQAHSEDELREMHAHLQAEHIRIGVEMEQVTEALARKARRGGGRSPRSGARPARPGATQKRILDAVSRLDAPASPAEIIAEMQSHGSVPSRGSIHNTIGRLVKNGLLTRLSEGQYQLASRNGAHSGDRAGPPRNETDEPLLTATGVQEATFE